MSTLLNLVRRVLAFRQRWILALAPLLLTFVLVALLLILSLRLLSWAVPGAWAEEQPVVGAAAYQVAQRSLEVSSQLRVDHQVIEAARVEGAQAQVDWWPQLTLTARYTRLSPFEQPTLGPFVGAPGVDSGPVPADAQLVVVDGSFPAIVDNYLLEASVVVPITDYVFRVHKRVAAAEQSERASVHQLRATEQRVARDAGLTYYGWARAVAARRIAEQSQQDAARRTRNVGERRAVGKVSRAEVLSARAREQAAQRVLQQARFAEERLLEDLRIMTEWEGKRWQPPDISAELEPYPSDDSKRLVERARAHRAELKALEARRQKVEFQREAVTAQALPRLDLFANAQYANPNRRFLPPEQEWRGTWDAGVQLTWSPNTWARSARNQESLGVSKSRLEAEKAAFEDAMRREINGALQAVRDADAQALSTRAEVEAAAEARRAAEEAHRLGKVSLYVLLDADSELLVARLSRLDALVKQRSARLELAYATGADLRERSSWP